MNKFLFLITWSIIFLVTSCKTKQGNDNKINSINCLNISVNGDTMQLHKIDSIYSEFNTVSLETKNECLISQISKIIFYADKIYIKDNIGKLFVFDINGKYLYKIGEKGKSPYKYLELRDFDIDNVGNIYILDFKKILKYNNDGTFNQKFSFNFLSRTGNKIFCNPFDFLVKSDGNFYIWGGSLEIDDNSKNRFFSMYEMTEEGKITNKYFTLRYYNTVGIQNNRLKHYKNMTIIKPIFGCDTIYSIGKEGIEARYNIDFGTKTSNIQIPNCYNYNSFTKYYNKIDQIYYHSIENFIETNDWIYFMFVHKKILYNVFYSKILKKSFLSDGPLVSGRIASLMVYSCYNESFVSFMYPDYIIELINKCKEPNAKSLSMSEKKFVERYAHIKPTDNPILIILSMKKY